ncbi:hypothetical protein BBP40_002599 [Aspergillus hancockii]|nr:hypothetical protein BBP40_002599 [Aspergillus hancockii]
MSGLGFVDIAGDNLYSANAITEHMAAMPSARLGAVHFQEIIRTFMLTGSSTTEALMSGAFLMRKLKGDNFTYLFKELDMPFQNAHQKWARRS